MYRSPGIKGDETVLSIANLKEGDTGRYVFDDATNLGPTLIAPGASVEAVVAKDFEGKLGLFTTEPLLTNNSIVPKVFGCLLSLKRLR